MPSIAAVWGMTRMAEAKAQARSLQDLIERLGGGRVLLDHLDTTAASMGRRGVGFVGQGHAIAARVSALWAA